MIFHIIKAIDPPTLLSIDSYDRRDNAKGDVYSLGIVIQETVYCPYDMKYLILNA